jgi:site-specific recombinase XerD
MLSQASASTSTSSSALLERKIEECTAGLTASVTKQLISIGENNAATIVKYTEVMRTEVNTSNHYRRDLILLLCRFSKYHSDKPFKEISRENIVNFLDSLRKTETKDPMHKWIGTYNLFLIHLTRFFKWLYSPDLASKLSLKDL